MCPEYDESSKGYICDAVYLPALGISISISEKYQRTARKRGESKNAALGPPIQPQSRGATHY